MILLKTINETFESYFTKEGVKPCDLLRKIKDVTNKVLPFGNSISRIRVYTRKNNYLWLVSATDFLWDRRITIKKSWFNPQESNCVYCIKYSEHDELWFVKHIGEVEYYFCCDCSKRSIMWIKLLTIQWNLSKMFTKTSLVLLLNHRLTIKRQKNFDEIKNDVIFVNRAINIMHFIRNRMSPITNIIEYYKNKDSIPEETKNKMEKKIEQVVLQAEKDLNDINDIADFLLDKSKNPFDEKEIVQTKASQLYIIVSEIVQMLLESTIEPGEKLINSEVVKDNPLFIKTNIKEFKILVSDWVSNIKKYKVNYYYGGVEVENDSLVFRFENDFQHKEIELVRQLVSDINSNSKDAVISGKGYGHGLFIIKSIAQLMDYTINAQIAEKESIGKILIFNIVIKLYHEKNTNL